MRVLGVDLGIHKVAVAAMCDGGFDVYALSVISSQPRATQLSMLGQFVYDIAAEHDAEYIWIEDNLIGNNRKYSIQLAQTMGAVLCQFGMECFDSQLVVDVVNVKSWKKRIIGNGNAGKDDVRNYVLENHPAYAELCGADQDKFDATCVGLYGLQVVAQSTNLHLADAT